jgi:DNA primase
VVEGEAPWRARRREPERGGEDDRVGLLRAAAPGRAVSTPLRWEEVVDGLDPRDFTMDVVLDRVRRDGDLFASVLAGKQSLRDALASLES